MFRDINTMLPHEIGSVDSNVLFVFDNDSDNIMTDIGYGVMVGQSRDLCFERSVSLRILKNNF